MLTAPQFHEKLLARQVPVKYTETLDDGVFMVHVEHTMTPERYRVMMQAIEDMPEVRAAGLPQHAGGRGILHVVPTWVRTPQHPPRKTS